MSEPRHDAPVDAEARRRLFDLVNGAWTTQLLAASVELGLPDLLASEPRTPAELAKAASCHEPSLARLLGALASLGLVEPRDDGSYALTALGAMLRSDAGGSMAGWSLFAGRRLWGRWAGLAESVRTGESSRRRSGGSDDFADYERDRAAGLVFQRAMSDVTRPVAEALVAAVDLAGVRTIADVGGGLGRMLATVLAAHPSMRGILFDLAHVLDPARGELERAGVADRCELVGGDFFEAVPAGADAYLLKSVLHDWDDGRASTILRRCADAMHAGARLLVVERLRPERYSTTPRDQAIARSDLTMLISLGGRERTEREYRALLDGRGLAVDRVTPLPGEFAVIDARRRS